MWKIWNIINQCRTISPLRSTADKCRRPSLVTPSHFHIVKPHISWIVKGFSVAFWRKTEDNHKNTHICLFPTLANMWGRDASLSMWIFHIWMYKSTFSKKKKKFCLWLKKNILSLETLSRKNWWNWWSWGTYDEHCFFSSKCFHSLNKFNKTRFDWQQGALPQCLLFALTFLVSSCF